MPTTLQKLFSLFRVSTTLPVLYTNSTFDVPVMDERGAIFVQNVINGSGSANLMLAGTDNTDNQASTPLAAASPAPQVVVSRLYGYDGTGNNWDRLRVAGNDADAVAVETIGVLKQAAALYGFNGVTFDRLLSQANNGDAVAVSTLGLLKQAAFSYQFNGTTFDRVYNNTDIILLASTARTVATNTPDFNSFNAKGIHIFLNVTVAAGIETLTTSLNIKDPASGAYNAVFSSTAFSGTGLFRYSIYPGIAVTTGVTQSVMLSRISRITITPSAAGSFTYSVAACLIT